MAKGDGRGGNHGNSGNGCSPAHEIGPADILLGRLILLAREGNRQAVREALQSVSEAEITLGRAAQCVRAGALQSAIKILDGEFARVFGDAGDTQCIRQRQSEIKGHTRARRSSNTPLADTGLPIRVVNTLEEVYGVIAAGELCKYSAEELRMSGFRGGGIGVKSIEQIEEELAKLGLALRGSELPAVMQGAEESEAEEGERVIDDGDCNELGDGYSQV